MKKLQILRITAATVLGVGFSAGVASAATTGTITGPTGPDSNNQVVFNGSDTRDVDNRNRVNVQNKNHQDADSGKAEVRHNTTGGNAASGDATNDNWFEADLRVNNSGSSAAALNGGGGGAQSGSITGPTGPDSNNQVTFNGSTNVTVDNENCVTVDNDNHQSASTGDAKVEDNTTGGNATSGSATNVNTSKVTLSITN